MIHLKKEEKISMEINTLSYLNENTDVLISMAKNIWDHPEIGLQETHASKLIADQLDKAGFHVRRGIAQMPTAFIASWGETRPIIGVLGEYDALPGIYQEVATEKKTAKEGWPGHGCGHNLLGVGSLGAALAVKEAMDKHKIKGTIRYYGCPAEETLIGKVFMARDSVFDDLDAAITWHPWYANTGRNSATLAMNSFKLNFHGVSSHASQLGIGRSALDAVVLAEVGINHLRDNVIKDARIHGVITNGGLQPNVIPAYAQSWYYVRAPKRKQVEEIYQRVLDIAKAAALMTGTKLDLEFIVGCYDYLPNQIIIDTMLEKLKKIGPPKFTEEERAFAKELESKVARDIMESALETYKLTREELGGSLCHKIIDEVGGFAKGDLLYTSSDVGMSLILLRQVNLLRAVFL